MGPVALPCFTLHTCMFLSPWFYGNYLLYCLTLLPNPLSLLIVNHFKIELYLGKMLMLSIF